MKIVVAIDSLKGSLTSIQAGEAIEKGIKKVDLEAEIVIKPLADGGEGTVDALVDGMGGNMEFIKVTGPAGKSVLAKYGIIRPTKSYGRNKHSHYGNVTGSRYHTGNR